jgi:hypothetical protein
MVRCFWDQYRSTIDVKSKLLTSGPFVDYKIERGDIIAPAWTISLAKACLANLSDLASVFEFVQLMKATNGRCTFDVDRNGYLVGQHRSLEMEISMPDRPLRFIIDLVHFYFYACLV